MSAEHILDRQLDDFHYAIDQRKTSLDSVQLSVTHYARALRKFYGNPLILVRPDSKWFAQIDYSFTLKASIGFSLDGEIVLRYRDPNGLKQRRQVASVKEVRDHLDYEWNRIQAQKQTQDHDESSDKTC